MNKTQVVIFFLFSIMFVGCKQHYIDIRSAKPIKNESSISTENINQTMYVKYKVKKADASNQEIDDVKYCKSKKNFLGTNKFYSALYANVDGIGSKKSIIPGPVWVLMHNDKVSCNSAITNLEEGVDKDIVSLVKTDEHKINISIENSGKTNVPYKEAIQILSLVPEPNIQTFVVVLNEINSSVDIENKIEKIATAKFAINNKRNTNIEVTQDIQSIKVELEVKKLDADLNDTKGFYAFKLEPEYKSSLLDYYKYGEGSNYAFIANEIMSLSLRQNIIEVYRHRVEKLMNVPIEKKGETVSSKIDDFSVITDPEIISQKLNLLNESLTQKLTYRDRDIVLNLALRNSLKRINADQKSSVLSAINKNEINPLDSLRSPIYNGLLTKHIVN